MNLNRYIVTIKIYMPSKVVILHFNLHLHALAGKVPRIDNVVHIALVLFIYTHTI